MMPLIGISIGIGLFLFLILALNRQERKDRELQANVRRHLNSENLRGLISLRTRSIPLLFGKRVLLDIQNPVYSDFGNRAHDGVWETMKDIRHDLPANVRLKIRFNPDKQIRATITMERNGKGR
jgi:hypothetical protein